jgi:hypothetical protein
MIKSVTLCLSILFVLSVAFSCTNKNEVKLQIEETKKQIRLIDEQIYQLEAKRGFIGEESSVSRIRIDPVINRLKSERNILLIKLNSLFEKL